ncbi:MAG TPA: cytochrome-c peroxidase [Lysobacter sp.]
MALRERAAALFKPLPLRQDVVRGEPISAARIELGRMLFFDPRLSSSQVISCNSCHSLSTAGVDNVPTSVGHGFQRGPRNAPTVFNSVFNASQFWDGRAQDLAEQAKGPVQAVAEMNNRPERVVATLRSMPGYVAAFEAAFPGMAPGSAVSFDNTARALEAFEATLITPDAPFDRFLVGEAGALDARQKRGLDLFIGNGCVACHAGINLGGQSFFKFGVIKPPDPRLLPAADQGRFAITHVESDRHVFRTAPLRNVALTAPYFHAGQVWDLREAVRIMAMTQLGRDLGPADAGDIAAFLESLNGKMPQVAMPPLPASTATTPRPLID